MNTIRFSQPHFIFVLSLAVLLPSCATLRPDKPAHEYSTAPVTLAPSVINIPVDVTVSEVEKMLNNQLKGLIYEDNSLEDNGGDNLMVKAWKAEDIRITLEDNVLSCRLPLKLWIKAGWKVEKFGISLSDYREAEAGIALKFRSALTLNPDWTVTSATTSDGYEWLSTPVVKVGPVNVSVKALADVILKTNLRTLNREIDKAVGSNVDLRKHLQSLWIDLQKPFKVNDEYGIWLKISPQSVLSTPLSGKDGRIRHTVGIESVIEASIGRQPAYIPVAVIPDLKVTSRPADDFRINLVTDIPFTTVNDLAVRHLAGRTFTSGRYAVTVKAIDMYAAGEKMAVHLNLAGSLKGDVYLTGNPAWDEEKQSIRIDGLDFELQTRNALARTGNWLFHSTLVKTLQENLVFPLSEQAAKAREMMNEQLKGYPLAEGFILRGKVSGLSAGKIMLTKESIRIPVLLNGKVSVVTQ